MVLTVVLTLFLSVLFGACSPKKNTAASRNYQAFITRYNIYYNGDTHFRETLADMESKYEDDYSRQVFMHPVEAKSDPLLPQPSGNFDRKSSEIYPVEFDKETSEEESREIVRSQV